MDILGQIKLKIEGEMLDCSITSDGYAILPDGQRRKLSEKSFEAIRQKFLDRENGEQGDLSHEEEEVETEEEQGEEEEYVVPAPTTSKLQVITSVFTMLMSLVTAGLLLFTIMTLKKDAQTPAPDSTEPPSVSEEDPGQTFNPLPVPSQQEIDEAKTILIIARIETPDGKQKEVVLGYFTTDGEDADIDVGEETDPASDADAADVGSDGNDSSFDMDGEQGGIMALSANGETGGQ